MAGVIIAVPGTESSGNSNSWPHNFTFEVLQCAVCSTAFVVHLETAAITECS